MSIVRCAFPLFIVAAIAAALLSGVAGGLLRAGTAWPAELDAGWAARAGADHAALMICAFMGTVIAVERAVALKARWAWLAPACSALAGVLLILRGHGLAQWLLVAAAGVFVAVNAAIVAKQRAAHTLLLFLSAVCWLAGNLLYARPDGRGTDALLPWWFAFLVITIAAERLEMTRLTPRPPAAVHALYGILALMVAGATLAALAPAPAGALFGASLVLLAAWLFRFDIARRTVRAGGLSRYMAVCLLGGYAWLAVAGLAWIATATLGAGGRDVAIHALALGFIVSMMLGHAPVILPAVARVKLAWGPWFYAPLALLHLSLVARLVPGSLDYAWKRLGAQWNALAILLFAATMVGSVLLLKWRHRNEQALPHPSRAS